MGRLIAIVVLTLGLLPGTCVRSPPAPFVGTQALTMQRIAVPRMRVGEMTLEGAWQLDSGHSDFNGFSALLALPDGRFLAATDGGTAAFFPQPGTPGQVRIAPFGGVRPRNKMLADIESLALDPRTGDVWAGYEHRHAIARFDPQLRQIRRVLPEQMRRWPANSGAEAMVRLADGRFVVLAEGGSFVRDSGGLLFAADPAGGGKAASFRYGHPQGYRPVDMAQLPDGRVLILLRRVRLVPPGFEALIEVADPAAIRPGKVWRGRAVARLQRPVPLDNYEGLAIRPQADGSVAVWLVSDDNNSTFQRTVLLHLRWMPDKQKGAPAKPARPFLIR